MVFSLLKPLPQTQNELHRFISVTFFAPLHAAGGREEQAAQMLDVE